MKTFGLLWEIIVTVVVLFILPILCFQYHEELLLEGEMEYQTIYFTDSIRNVGFISRNMYEQFLENLDRTNHVYEVEMTVFEKNMNSDSSYGYWKGIYTEQVLDAIYGSEERFLLHQGNLLTVAVHRKDSNAYENVLKRLGVLRQGVARIPFRYGGMIRDECF